MKNSCGSARKQLLTVRSLILIFLIAAALHLLLLFLFRPLPIHIAESRNESRYTLFFNEKDLIRRPEDAHGLRYWLHYTEPERILKPDLVSGFSMFHGKKQMSEPDPARFDHALFEPQFAVRFPVREEQFDRSPADFISGTEIPVFTRNPEILPVLSGTRQYPVWMDESGQVFEGLFWKDDPAAGIIKKRHADRFSVLRLTLRNNFAPRVEIVRSCGDTELDLFAVRQLKARKENFASENPSGVRYFTVIWQMPGRAQILKDKPL